MKLDPGPPERFITRLPIFEALKENTLLNCRIFCVKFLVCWSKHTRLRAVNYPTASMGMCKKMLWGAGKEKIFWGHRRFYFMDGSLRFKEEKSPHLVKKLTKMYPSFLKNLRKHQSLFRIWHSFWKVGSFRWFGCNYINWQVATYLASMFY